MAIVPAESDLRPEDSAVPLARYAQLVVWREDAFWGVNRNLGTGYDEYMPWQKPSRDMVARYLVEAQTEIEQEAGYPMMRTWYADEERDYDYPVMSLKSRVVTGGIRAEDDIDLDAVVVHAADPATVTVATTITDVDEIRVYYPASLGVEGPIEISPSDIDVDGVNAVISIPRSRMVLPTLVDNPEAGIDYTNPLNFLQVVDVKRVYNDPSTHAILVWPHICSGCGGTSCSCPNCTETTQSACMYVRDGTIGAWDVLPAGYSAGVWTVATATCCDTPRRVRLNYLAGPSTPTRQAQDAIIRLAHAKMPLSPCTKDQVVQSRWKEDRNIPRVLTAERLNCPFGLSDGAWIAYQFSQALAVMRAGGIET